MTSSTPLHVISELRIAIIYFNPLLEYLLHGSHFEIWIGSYDVLGPMCIIVFSPERFGGIPSLMHKDWALRLLSILELSFWVLVPRP